MVKPIKVYFIVLTKYILNLVSVARDIKIIKKLVDVEAVEKESASFICEISHDDVEYQWFRGNAKIKASENVKMRQEGKDFKRLEMIRTFMLLFENVVSSSRQNLYTAV